MKRHAAALMLALVLPGCAVSRAMLADSSDLQDYRAFRVAADQGVRLARAQTYLQRHPKGAWFQEVQQVFDEEEAEYFEATKGSRLVARDYLTNLPAGPHAEAAVALLTAFDTNLEELELQQVVRDARRSDAMLERASQDRKRVAETIMASLAAMLDLGSYGAPLAESKAGLRELLMGSTASTWGSVPKVREQDLFFTVPTTSGRTSRVLSLRTTAIVDGNLVVGLRLVGTDMFICWYESVRLALLDGSQTKDRIEAAVFAREILAGASESLMPAARCAPPQDQEDSLLIRSCDGLLLVATAGLGGRPDEIQVTWQRKPGSTEPNTAISRGDP
jgi:hypothetical protein